MAGLQSALQASNRRARKFAEKAELMKRARRRRFPGAGSGQIRIPKRPY